MDEGIDTEFRDLLLLVNKWYTMKVYMILLLTPLVVMLDGGFTGLDFVTNICFSLPGPLRMNNNPLLSVF